MATKSPKPDISATNSGVKIDKLIEMINDLKNSQNKIVTSLNSCRESIKNQDKKFVSFGAKLDLLSTQLFDVIKENKSLKEKVEKLELKLSEVEHAQSSAPLGSTS